MTSTLPQSSYFRESFTLPGTQWRISGHSRALERTGFLLTGGGANIILDAGVDLPDLSHPDVILITHTHIDHCNALPMLARYAVQGSPMHIFVPGPVMQRLREFVSLSFSIKVNDADVVPDHYTSPPPPGPREYTGEPTCHPWEESIRKWYPVQHDQQISLALGKGGKKNFIFSPVEVMHTVSTVGYILSERRTKIIPEVLERLKSECSVSKELGGKLKAARENGETVDYILDIPICAFICDTTAAALKTGMHATQILSTPVIMIECTYLEESFTAEANRKGHVVWSGPDGLCSVVRDKLSLPMTRNNNDNVVDSSEENNSTQGIHKESESSMTTTTSATTFVLIHFSLRYSDVEIRSFFMDVEKAGLGSSVATEPRVEGEPPHVVLWLDTGIVRLWYYSR